jgi:hypothetical protein
VTLLVIYAGSVSLCGFDFHHCKAKKNWEPWNPLFWCLNFTKSSIRVCRKQQF